MRTDKIMEYLKTWSDKYKYILIACLCGLALVCFPSKSTASEVAAAEHDLTADVLLMERRLEESLSKMTGVGKTDVVLTARCSSQAVYAYDEEQSLRQSESERTADSNQTMVFSGSGSSQQPVKLQTLEPEYRGALIICEGGKSAAVKLIVTEAVSALTGIGSDKIVVSEMK